MGEAIQTGVVVGAGPTGLFLALALGLLDRRARVVDRRLPLHTPAWHARRMPQP
jgi:2-polyprenyl-6-methoxyphenol hydroxylase-like FAD-dependent oxidoreductase